MATWFAGCSPRISITWHVLAGASIHSPIRDADRLRPALQCPGRLTLVHRPATEDKERERRRSRGRRQMTAHAPERGSFPACGVPGAYRDHRNDADDATELRAMAEAAERRVMRLAEHLGQAWKAEILEERRPGRRRFTRRASCSECSAGHAWAERCASAPVASRGWSFVARVRCPRCGGALRRRRHAVIAGQSPAWLPSLTGMR
jgi:hypothetical protein